MRRNYYWSDILVMPDDLIAFAWSAPMRDLAAQLEMSDVGLKKLLTSHGIAAPPQGYWNKVHAGKPVPDRPRPPERRPGGLGRIRVDPRFAKVLPVAPPMPSPGSFRSKYVPENLEELRQLELQAIGKVPVPKSLEKAHPSLQALLAKEERRREKVTRTGWQWDGPVFDHPVGRRRLRILNAVFLALAKRGHDGNVHEHNGEIHARAIIGDTPLGIEVSIHGGHRTIQVSGYARPSPDLPASTPLMFRLAPSFDRNNTETWCDDKEGTLEKKLAQIVAAIITAGEARFRRDLREAEERAEEQRIEAEKRRQEKLAALNRERIANLYKSGELLRQAADIRSLVAKVCEAIKDAPDVTDSELAEWESWALAEADKLDPVRSGQFLTHLRPPVLEGD